MWLQSSVQTTMKETVREFLEYSTIHGMVFISTSRSKLLRLFWLVVVTAGFTGSILLIENNFTAWRRSPISTTIQTVPIRDVQFPSVIVCPPPQTFTGLHIDLERTRNTKLDNVTLHTLLDFIPDAVFDASFETKYEKFVSFTEKRRFMNWYLGHSSITFPYGKCPFSSTLILKGGVTKKIKKQHYIQGQKRSKGRYS